MATAAAATRTKAADSGTPSDRQLPEDQAHDDDGHGEGRVPAGEHRTAGCLLRLPAAVLMATSAAPETAPSTASPTANEASPAPWRPRRPGRTEQRQGRGGGAPAPPGGGAARGEHRGHGAGCATAASSAVPPWTSTRFALGRVLLAFVEIDTQGWVIEPLVAAVKGDPRVEDLHPTAGDTHFLAKVRGTSPDDLQDLQDLQDLLYALYRVPGVRNTRTHVVLRSHIKRPPSGEDSRGPAGPD